MGFCIFNLMSESHFHFTEEKPFRWGVIGCGSVTEKKSVPAYQIMAGFDVVMVMGRNAEKVGGYAKRHKIHQWCTDAKAMINHPEIDAIYIATPPDSHKQYALLVADAGKPCCIEKPMAPNYKDSLEIYKTFKTKGLPLFIAYYRRSLPRFLKIKNWLDEGLIGKVEHIHWVKSKQPNDVDLNRTYNWRTDKNIAPGGYFDDLASHGLDLFAFLLGDIKDATGHAKNMLGLYTAFDKVSGTWEHTNGITGEGIWDFGAQERKDVVQISGSEGKITFSVLDEAPLLLENGQGVRSLEIPNPEHIQQYHVANIKSHLLGKGTHPSTGKSGLQTSWVMDKILGIL